jgi:hypothetical protein
VLVVIIGLVGHCQLGKSEEQQVASREFVLVTDSEEGFQVGWMAVISPHGQNAKSTRKVFIVLLAVWGWR